MICPSCGQETDDQNQFCSKCGAPTVPQQPLQAGATGQPAPPPPPPGMQQQAPPPQPTPPPVTQQEAPPPQPTPPPVTQPPVPPADQGVQGNVYYQPQGAEPPQATPPPQVAEPPQPMQPPQAAQPPQIPPVPPPLIPGQYVQPTIQMPAAQAAPPPGTYQQPAYGQGPYAQPPQGQYPQQQYQPAPQYGQPFAPAATGKRGSTVLGLISLIMGAVMIGSTFLAWTSASAFGTSISISGWNYMRGLSSSLGGNSFSIVLHGSGIVFFTGFFSLLLGFLILVFSMIMFFRRRIGGVFVFIFALMATGVAAVDLAMVFSKMPGGTPGVGLWMFVGASFVALILGIVGLASSGG